MPEMNVGFDHDEAGKPVLVHPEHVNLGLAIDLAKPDGTRQLLVPSIKAAEQMDFAHFWTAYEDIVKKARGGKLTVEDFQGTTISLTNPGHHRHRPLGAPAHERPGRHHRRRRDGVPRRVAGREQRDPQPQRGQQDPHPDEHLRPPDHPGRPVRRVPAQASTSCSSARTASTTRSSRACGSRTSRSAGSRTSPPPTTTTSTRSPGSRSSSTPTGCAATSWPTPTRWSTASAATPTSTSPGHGLTLWDLDRHFATGGFGGEPFLKLRKILGILRDTYCRTVGIEYMHIQDPDQREWIQAKIEVALRQDDPRGAAAHPAPAQRRGGVRDVPADQVRRPEALLARGRRVGHRPARQGPQPGGRGRDGRGLHRYAAPRPPQRPGQHRRQVLRADLPRVRGQAGPQLGAGLRRRQVPPRHRGRVRRRERRGDEGLPRGQPLPPRGRQPGPRGHRPGQAGPAQPRGRGLHRAAGPPARRRRLRRAGRRRRDPQPVPAARLPHRRHRPRRHQQPGRLHDLAELVALVDLLHRRRPDDPGPDLPRQRRRPGGVRARRRARLRVPASGSTRTSSSTWSATAGAATTRATTRR